jgi:two-component system response regulator RstA
VPLLVACTAGRDLDHVLALEIGADDVLDATWPASVVAARLRSQWRQALRWRDDRVEPQELRFGALLLRRNERTVLLAQQPVLLTDGEFEVLWMLASRAGEAVSRADMLRRIRGTSDPFVDRSIDSRVYRIRSKLGDSGRTVPRIRGVRGSGYLFSAQGW